MPAIRTVFPLIVAAFLASTGLPARADEISFARTIQPILSRHCFACHGPDEEVREAELRLDQRDVAVETGAISPGKPEESELIRRVFSEDESERMPPAEAHDTLKAEEKEQLRTWIAQGAKYEQHWAFVPPQRPEVPKVANESWPQNAIDNFVLARLEAEGLQPSAEADRYTLVRRVYLDLIGLPPTPEEADAFVADQDPRAYDNLVDKLLASEHYGERWARQWMDLARYSDTNGYEKDRNRSIWPYRDWVIHSLNDDMPFAEFTIEQLAGDMLPNATVEQRTATGFHRNTMLNEEGGIDPLEYRFYAMVDRVATTGTVWMGLTTGCAQCHTHKYDPIMHTDYYGLMGLLNNADEPDLRVPTDEVVAKRRLIEAQIAQLEQALPGQFPAPEGEGPIEARRAGAFDAALSTWIESEHTLATPWTVLRASRLESNLPKLHTLEDGSILSTGDITKRDVFTLTFPLHGIPGPITALRLEVIPDERLPAGGPGRTYYEGRKGDFFLSDVTATRAGNPVKFATASHSYGKINIGSGSADATNVLDGEGSTGWSTAEREGQPHQLVLNLAEPLAAEGELQIEMLFERHFASSLGRFRISATSKSGAVQATQTPIDVEQILSRARDSWSDDERFRVRQYFLSVAPELAEARKRVDELRGQIPSPPETMVMQERTAGNPRTTHRHHRGEYLSPREEVAPHVPAVFASLSKEQPRDRLSFARWLVSEGNPLIGRVTVDRAWGALFGAGLVRSNGDFGTQSEPPTHPQMLDWLACEFVDDGWSLKKLHKLIVTSATYRQCSAVTPELLERDSENRLLARGPRFRADAETVRDLALHASGLLSEKIGGPSVYPPQPESVTALAYGGTAWPVSKGQDRYRRSLYTFSKRTAPFAAYTSFDGPTGEVCIAKRERSNTPLQALTLLNDVMFLEMAQALARTAVEKHPGSDADTATFLFRRFVTRPPSEEELQTLIEFKNAQLQRLVADELDVVAIAGSEGASADLAAWVMTARAVMNLDEAVTKQ